MAVATPIHFGLSCAYSAVMGALTRALAGLRLLTAGALLGLALYVVNLHGFTLFLPWFAVARGWITLAAHLAFGACAVLAFLRYFFSSGAIAGP